MFDLIIFDCDGVLVDSELIARAAMQSVYRESGIEVTDGMINAVVGMKMLDILASIERETRQPLPTERHADFWPATERLFRQKLQPTDGIKTFLETSSIPRCVASSSHHARIRASLEITGLMPFFAGDAIFSSHDVANGKPAPDLVLHAARRMGADPARCLVIEDSRFGIIGAKAAGMTGYGYLGASHMTALSPDELLAAGADAVAASWQEIDRLIAAAQIPV